MFGKRVIGEQAFAEQQKLVEEGRLHFGPRVVGPYKESVAGPRVQPQHEVDFQVAVAKVAGAVKPLVDLNTAQLEEVCDLVGVSYKARTPHRTLVGKLQRAFEARREPGPISSEEEIPADAEEEPQETEAPDAGVEAGEASSDDAEKAEP